MSNYIVIEINFEGQTRVLEGEYPTWEEACEVQEAMEWLHGENSYLITTQDAWMYDHETALP